MVLQTIEEDEEMMFCLDQRRNEQKAQAAAKFVSQVAKGKGGGVHAYAADLSKLRCHAGKYHSEEHFMLWEHGWGFIISLPIAGKSKTWRVVCGKSTQP